MDVERRGSSCTDVIERAGVNDKLDLLRPPIANIDLLFDFLLEAEAVLTIQTSYTTTSSYCIDHILALIVETMNHFSILF